MHEEAISQGKQMYVMLYAMNFILTYSEYAPDLKIALYNECSRLTPTLLFYYFKQTMNN